MKATFVVVLVLLSCAFNVWGQFDANCFGNRKTIVQLFEWRWADIVSECQNFLAVNGFCGVQVSPVNEHRVVMDTKAKRPWWERYQPVSYKIATRSGSETEFADMVQKCNEVGVRVYVDVVFNHMVAEDAGVGTGTGGSAYNSLTLDFPEVPYISNDFHKRTSDCKSQNGKIENYQDPAQVRNCRHKGLVDLDQRKSFVRQQMVAFMNKLIGIGVAGFRVDSAKYMSPNDLKTIFQATAVNTLNETWFPRNTLPFIYQDVEDLGNDPIKASDYFDVGRVTEFKYATLLSDVFSGAKQMKDLKGLESGVMAGSKALAFIDDPVGQRSLGSSGKVLSFLQPEQYKMANAFLLSYGYGQTRLMSSYRWDQKIENGTDQNTWQGPPSDAEYNIKPVTISQGGSCDNGWVCEHRWPIITSLVQFANIAGKEEVTDWWDDGENQIVFSRGDKALIAMNTGNKEMAVSVKTRLKHGRYCDIAGVISSDGTQCNGGQVVTIDSDGLVYITLPATGDSRLVAIHVERLLAEQQPEPDEPSHFDPHCDGDRQPIVHLFEWRWVDIALECERFLSKKGFCGVQVSPPSEHRVINYDVVKRPWWERYQPISYKIYTRSGNEVAFVDMVQRCNNVGVRIYVDVVFNHMAGEEAASGIGIGGTSFNTQTLQFPEVPYNSSHFHEKGVECKSSTGKVENWQDANEIRNCRLLGLVDLKQSDNHVRAKMTDYLNRLINIGVAGFRFDSSTYMMPSDIKALITSLNPLNSKWFPVESKAFAYQDVKDLGEYPIRSSEYSMYAKVSEFKYGRLLSEVFTSHAIKLKDLKTVEEGLLPNEAAHVFIDNHDNQRILSGTNTVLNFFSPREYKMAVTFMLAWPYGFPMVMSSYRWDRHVENGKDLNDWVGPPHDARYNIKAVTINSDQVSCGNDWVCEHRWLPISNMIQFRNVGGSNKVKNWWDDGDDQIAFSLGDQAFFAMNGGNNQMNVEIQTGMSNGTYCDVISGQLTADGSSCTGGAIAVDDSGVAKISIWNAADNPMIAIHAESRVTGTPGADPIVGYHRTVIFIYYKTQFGQSVFLRGGISHARRPSCVGSPVTCYIPIRYDHVNYDTKHYELYNAWSKGDKYLDWQGAEANQGDYQGIAADGSPLVWTTNAPTTDNGYNDLNTYGTNYHMLDVYMDCSSTDNGWFELKSILDGNWESDITQQSACSGSAGLDTPYTSNNHLGKCGYRNVFSWNSASCLIDHL